MSVSILVLACCSTRSLAWAAAVSVLLAAPARTWPWSSVTTTLSVDSPWTDLATLLTIAWTRPLEGVAPPVMLRTMAALAGVSCEERAPVWARTIETRAAETPDIAWIVLVSSPSRARW